MKIALAHRTNLRREHRRGFTLTEIAIVLGIVGLILGAIWVAAAAVYTNLRVSHANTEVLQIAQGVRTLFATSNTTGVAGDLTGSLITAGIIPTDIANVATSTATNPWAGGTTKVLAPAGMDSFTVELTSVPQAACIGLLSGVGGTSRDASLFMVAAKSAVGTTIQAAVPGTALTTAAGQVAAVTPVTAAQACSNATSNPVQFGFGLK